jgi:probable HAF family extracellular repeat protein
MAALGTLGGWQWSNALAINESGQAAGSAQLQSGAFRGVIWNEAGAVVAELGTLGGSYSWAQGMNDAGLVVGNSTTSAGWMHAFLYAGGTLIDLGTLGGGNSGAYDVNELGWIVGYSHLESGESVAFLYADGVLHDLNRMIGGSGWTLEEALAVNNAGQIVGTGLFGGERRGFRLDPLAAGDGDGLPEIHNPEPGTLAMLLTGVGLLGVGWSRRRRRQEL